jgi:hypothetical protein
MAVTIKYDRSRSKIFAYVYDTRAEAEAAVRYLRVAQVTWDPKIEQMR